LKEDLLVCENNATDAPVVPKLSQESNLVEVADHLNPAVLVKRLDVDR